MKNSNDIMYKKYIRSSAARVFVTKLQISNFLDAVGSAGSLNSGDLKDVAKIVFEGSDV